MNAVELIRRLHRHRQWVNGHLLASAERLTDEQLRQPFTMGQGSIWKSLVHLYAAEFVWLAALQGDEDPLAPGDRPDKLPGNQEAEGALSSLSELKAKWRELDQSWNDHLDTLTSEALAETVYKVSTSSGRGQRRGTARADVLLHVCTHAHYTTAQIINMMRHAGLERLPDPMLITMARRGEMTDV